VTRRLLSIGRCGVLCVPLLVLALVAAPASATVVETHPFLTELAGSPPQPQGSGFEDACGVALDSAGNRYVSDYFHDAIDIFGSSGGGFQSQILNESAGNGPCGLAVDPSGNLYVNNWRHEVLRLTPPSYLPSAATTIDPGPSTGVAVDPASGNVYVDDGDHIAEYEPSGSLVAEIGLGTLEEGYGVAVSTFPATLGDIYVPDAGDNTVKVYGPAGNQLPTIDGQGTPQAGFHYLVDSAIAIDPTDGHVFVADNIGHGQSEHPEMGLDEFTPAGTYRGQISRWVTHPQGEPGVSIEHQLTDAEPSGLAIDSVGNVYVTAGNFEAGESSGFEMEGKRIEGSLLYEFGPAVPAETLIATKTGTGVGAVKSEPAGINCGSACTAEYNVGEKVTLTATPDPHSTFAGWTGGGCSGTGTCKVTMSAAKAVSAEFVAIPQQTLDVSVTGAGEGMVTSSPVGIACGSGTCSEHFNEGSTVTLTAVPVLHNKLAHWSGCSSEPSPTECNVTMSAAKAVSAEFVAIPQQTLTVQASGNGVVTSEPAAIDCGAFCSENFDEGASVTLRATPAIHNRVAWSGCSSEPNPTECNVTMSAAKAVSAVFTPIPHSLSVSVVGAGSVSASTGAISGCGASGGTCSGTYKEGEAITLIATPAPGSSFAGFSGACKGTALCHLTIAADTVVSANFAAIPPTPVPTKLTLGKLTVTGAIAALKTTVSGPGTVRAVGIDLKRVDVTASSAGTVTLPLALSPAGKRALSRRGKLKVEVTLTFAPSDGSVAAIASQAVIFKAGPAQKSHPKHAQR
jgi:hypothetical protein